MSVNAQSIASVNGNWTATGTWGGTLPVTTGTIASPVSITVNTGITLTVNSSITGVYNIAVNGTGILTIANGGVLNATNVTVAGTGSSGATLTMATGAVLNVTGTVTINSGATSTWVPPSSVTAVQVQAWSGGGGGAGSSSSANYYSAGGGAGGNFISATPTGLSNSTVYSIVAGAGGAIGSTGSATTCGGVGGVTTITGGGNTILSIPGGTPGYGGTAAQKSGLGGINAGGIYNVTSTAGTYNSSAVLPKLIVGTQWAASTAYTLGQQVSYLTNLYTVTTAGTSTSTAPTNTSGSSAAGTTGAVFTYAGVTATATASFNTSLTTIAYVAFTPGSGYTSAPSIIFDQPWSTGQTYTAGYVYSNGGNLYQVSVGGTSGTSTGPTGTSTSATAFGNGTATFIYLGATSVRPTATALVNPFTISTATAVNYSATPSIIPATATYYLGGAGGTGIYVATNTTNSSGGGGGSATSSANGTAGGNATTGTGGTAAAGVSGTGGAGASTAGATGTAGGGATGIGNGGGGATGKSASGGLGSPGQVILTYTNVSTSGTLSALSTSYGTASSYTSFSVSATNALSGITVTAPTGFLVCLTTGGTYTSTVLVGAAGTISSTPVYIQLASTTTPGTYGTGGSGTVTIGMAATGYSSTLAMPASTVSAKALTVVTANITPNTKAYDGTTAATLTFGSGVLTGIIGSDVVSLSNTYTANFASAGVYNQTNSVAVSVSALSLTGANASYYTISPSYPLAVGSVNITPTTTATLLAGSLGNSGSYGSLVAGQSSQSTFTLNGIALTSGSVTLSAPAGFTVSPTTISESGTITSQTVTVTFSPTAATSYSGNITISGGGATTQNVAVTGTGTAPNAATGASIQYTSDNTQQLSWTAPTGSYDGVLVFAKVGSGTYPPSGAGSSYTGANANIGSATPYNGYALVYSGTGTSVEVTGLTANTAYYYQIFAYGASAYSSSITANGSTLSTPAAVTSLSVSSLASQTVSLSWSLSTTTGTTSSNYWNNVMVIAYPTSGSITAPSGNGSTYTANATYGSGTAVGNGYVVYYGTGSSTTVSSLTNFTGYTFATYVRHGSLWSAVSSTTATPVPYASGDYVSLATGNYSATATWSTWNGSALVAASNAPTAISNVWIEGGYTVTINSVITNAANTVTIGSGSTLTYTSAGSLTAGTVTIASGTLSMASGGILNVEASSIVNNSGTFTPGTGTINYNILFYDNLNRTNAGGVLYSGSTANNTTYISGGGIPSVTYTANETATAVNGTTNTLFSMNGSYAAIAANSGYTGIGSISAPYSTITNNVTTTPAYNTTLASNAGTIIWSFNMQNNRSTQFGSTSLQGVILGSTANAFNSGNGYAVVITNATTTGNLIELVSFTGGLTSTTITSIISTGTTTPFLCTTCGTGSVSNTNYWYSVQVSYNAVTGKWSLYTGGIGASATDPLATSYTQVGTSLANSTYTNTALNYFGYCYDHLQSNTAAFDNLYIQNVPTITPSVSSMTGFTYVEAAGGPSTAQSLTVSATAITNPVTVTAGTNWLVSTTQNGTYSSSVTLTPTSNAISGAAATVWVKLISSLTNSNSPFNSGTDILTITSLGASTQTVQLNGTVTAVSTPSAMTLANTTDNRQYLTWSSIGNVLVFASTSSTAYTPSGNASNYTGANANIGSASSYGGYSLVYNGSAQNVEVTGLTNNTTYYYQIFNYNGSTYSAAGTGTSANGVAAVQSVTSLSATQAVSGQSVLSWTNPTYNTTQSNYWDNVLVVGYPANVTTPVPSGSFTGSANATYGSGTAIGNGYAVSYGTGTGVTVTNLTNFTNYKFAAYTWHAATSTWSAAATISALPLNTSVLTANDFISVATGNYNTSTTWNQWTGTALTTTSSVPSSSSNVWIGGATTVTVSTTSTPSSANSASTVAASTSYAQCNNLYVFGTLLGTTNSGTNGTSGNGTVNPVIVSGTNIQVGSAGVIGNSNTGDTYNGISFYTLNTGTTTIANYPSQTGGAMDVGRIIVFPNSATPSSVTPTLEIARNVNFHYHGSTNLGAAFALGLENTTSTSNGVTTNYVWTPNGTITIDNGATVTMDKWSCLGAYISIANNYAVNFTLNVNGNLTFTSGVPATTGTGNQQYYPYSNNGFISMGSTVANSGTSGTGNLIHVGSTGIITVPEFYPNSSNGLSTTGRIAGTGAAIGIKIDGGGIFNVTSVADFSVPGGQVVSGSGSFNFTGAVTSPSPTFYIGVTNGLDGLLPTGTNNLDQSASTYSFVGTAAQSTGTALPNSIYGLVINNSAGVTLSQATTVTNTLSLASGNLTTSATNLLTLNATASDNLTASSTSGSINSYVVGPLQMTSDATTSTTSLAFPIGKNSAYSVALLSVTQANPVSTTYTAEAFVGTSVTPNYIKPGTISAVSSYRYYTLSSGTPSNIASANVEFGYGGTDATGGTINTVTPSNLRIAESTDNINWTDIGPSSGGVSSNATITSNAISVLGSFVVGNANSFASSPTLTANSPSVAANYTITFTDDPTWRSAITSVSIGSTALSLGTDYTIASGVVTIIPNGSTGSITRTSGQQTITIIATGYYNATQTYIVSSGSASQLVIGTQPVASAATTGGDGVVLATSPIILVEDVYGNTVSSYGGNITATLGSGSWSIGGTTTATASSGSATFSGITATNYTANSVSGTITFSASGLASVTSSSISVKPPTTYYWVGNGTATTWGASTTTLWSTTLGGSPVSVSGSNPTDIYIFDGHNIGGGTVSSSSVTVKYSVANLSIGQLIVKNNCALTLNENTGGYYVTINGDNGLSVGSNGNPSGSDLYIDATSSLTGIGNTASYYSLSSGTNAVINGYMGITSGSFNLNGTASATINGTLLIGFTGGSSSYLNVASANKVTVNGILWISTNSTISALGTSVYNAINIANGGTLIASKGYQLLNSTNIVNFQTGSTYSLRSTLATLGFDGYTFSNINYDSTSTNTVTGSSGYTINGNLSMIVGSIVMQETGLSYINGNISIANVSGTSLQFSPASAATVVLGGTSQQSITNNYTSASGLQIGVNQTVQLSNTVGVVLGSNIGSASYTPGKINIVSGYLNTQAYNLTIGTLAVGTGTTLEGTGTITTTTATTVNGIISPATSGTIGTLTLSSLNLGTGGTYYVDINNTTGTAGTNWDKLVITGSGAFTNSATSGSNFTVALHGTIANFTNTSAYSWVIGTYVGTAPSVSNIAISTAGITNSLAGSFSISIASGNIILTYSPIPTAPTNVIAVSGNGSATVSFTLPTNSSVVTSYTVTSTPPASLTQSTTSGSPITISGLTNLVSYTFIVTANETSVGNTASAASNAVIPSATTTWQINNGVASWTASNPDATQSAVIATNLNNDNVGTSFSNCANLTINSGVTFTLNSTVTVTGAFVNNGIITGTGTIILAGSSSQSITGTGTISNLTLSNNLGAIVSSGNQSVTGVLTVSSGTLNAGNDGITLKSTSITNSAIVDHVGGAITGTVTVERYIPQGYRAYRDMAPQVYNAGTIFKNWQESGSVTANTGIFITGAAAADPNNAKGVTSATSLNPTPGSGSNFLDWSLNGIPSCYNFLNSTGKWTSGLTHTDTALDVFQGYRVLIRGARDFNLYLTGVPSNEPGQLDMLDATTLRATGNLVYGDVTYTNSGVSGTANGGSVNSTNTLNSSTDTSFSMVANPYVAPVNWATVYSISTGLNASYWYLDPTAGSSGNYLADNALSGNSLVNNSSGTTTNYTLSGASGYIQPGQAFFVQNDGSHSSRMLKFTEASKNGASLVRVFGTTAPLSKIYLSLLKNNAGKYALLDGAAAAFSSNFTNTFGPQDAKKLSGSSDNLSITDKGRNLSIDGRLPATISDVLPISLSSLSGTDYKLVINATTYTANGFAPYLVDAYSKTTTAITVIDTIAFTANASVAATYQNRFSIVFKPTTLSVNSIVASATLNGTIATIKWNTVGEKSVANYLVEKSTDGTNFTSIGQQAAKNTATASYSATDKDVVSTTSYYRIKAISTDGTIAYSNVVKLTPNNSPLTTIYPNPLKGKTLNVQLGNVVAGKYVVIIYNSLGQKVAEQAIIHAGGNGTHAVNIESSIAKGVYNVVIKDVNSEEQVFQSTLSVQ